MEQGFNTKRFLITLGFVLITALAVGGATYYVMNEQAQKDRESFEKTIQDLQKQIDDLKKTETVTNTNATTSTETTPASDWHTYLNADYNFQLTFPESWKGYKVVKSDMSKYALASYEFQLHSNKWNEDSTLMGISVYTPQQYNNKLYEDFKSELPPENSVILTTSKYVFVYFHPQDYPEDLRTQANAVPSILDTFTLIK